MISILKSKIPRYLRTSELYLSFSEADDGEKISVPNDCLKFNLVLASNKGVEHLLLTMRFWILKEFPEQLIKYLLKYWSEALKQLLEKYELSCSSALKLLNNLHILNVSNKYKFGLAAEHGRIDFMKYFAKRRRGIGLTFQSIKLTAENGYLECLQYIYANLTPDNVQKLFSSEIGLIMSRNGHLQCLQWVTTNGMQINVDMCVVAAETGQLKCLHYLLSQSKLTHASICIIAAQNNHVDFLKCAVQRGCDVNTLTWEAAVSQTTTQCLKYLLSAFPDYELTLRLPSHACAHRSVACLQLLHTRGCPIDTSAVTAAAQSGSVECLTFLQSIGFDCWVPSTMMTAAQAGHLELLKVLCEYGVWEDTVAMVAAQLKCTDCYYYLLKECARRHKHTPYAVDERSTKCLYCSIATVQRGITKINIMWKEMVSQLNANLHHGSV